LIAEHRTVSTIEWMFCSASSQYSVRVTFRTFAIVTTSYLEVSGFRHNVNKDITLLVCYAALIGSFLSM